jgi:hypothetical protein
MSTQYRLVQSGKTASGGCSAGQGSLQPVAPRIIIIIIIIIIIKWKVRTQTLVFDSSLSFQTGGCHLTTLL